MEVKTKGYTYTRISRALLNLSLGVTEKEVSELKAESYVTYIRILGFRRQASGLLCKDAMGDWVEVMVWKTCMRMDIDNI